MIQGCSRHSLALSLLVGSTQSMPASSSLASGDTLLNAGLREVVSGHEEKMVRRLMMVTYGRCRSWDQHKKAGNWQQKSNKKHRERGEGTHLCRSYLPSQIRA